MEKNKTMNHINNVKIPMYGSSYIKQAPKGYSRWRNMGVFEGKPLYFCGDGGGWLFLRPVGGCLLSKCNSVVGCPSQKLGSVGILHSNGILRIV